VTRFLLDSGIASDYINRRHGVYERARLEVSKGNLIGIGVPVLAESVSGIERSKSRDRNLRRLNAACQPSRFGHWTQGLHSNMAAFTRSLSVRGDLPALST
jgi:hypothetical protein